MAEANRQVKTLELKAYDAMLHFDKEYNEAQTSGYPLRLLSVMCTTCGVELAHTQAEIGCQRHGLLGVYPENDIETWRIFCTIRRRRLALCPDQPQEAAARAVYGRADGNGKQHPPLPPASDFVTRYTAINSTNKRTETAEYYSLDPDDGLTMNLEVNYLCSSVWRKRILTTLLNTFAVISCVPLDSETSIRHLIPAYLTFTGGQADKNQMAAITSITIKCRKCSLVRGKNRLEAKSKRQNISGLGIP